MKNEKGFTLIELLAVIVILGILMLIAIPSVTTYVNNSRKNAYIASAKKTIDGATALINAQQVYLYDTDTTYYIPGSCVALQTGEANSPFAEWKDRYIILTYNGETFDYYWASTDKAKMGIYLTYRENLEIDDIKASVQSIPTTVGIGSRSKIVIFEDPCDFNPDPIPATEHIPEKGSYTPPATTTTTTQPTSSLTWDYNDFKITFDKVTDGCDDRNSQIICYNATIIVKNKSDTETITRYVAIFDVPAGTELMNNGNDANKAIVTLSGTKLTVDGLKSNAEWNYLTPGKEDRVVFQMKYNKSAPFILSNGSITYSVLTPEIQEGTSGTVGNVTDMNATLPQLKIRLVRVDSWGMGNVTSKYDVYITNLTDEPLSNWSFIIEQPPAISNVSSFSLKKTKIEDNVYRYSDQWNNKPTLAAGETYHIQGNFHITSSDPTVLPIIR